MTASADGQTMPTEGTAVLVIDVQNDFCEGGSLAVAGGAALATAISQRLATRDYAVAIATRDHHVDPGSHFSDHPDFVDTWPAHCVVGTGGVQLHANLDTTYITAIFDKGEYAAAYSGFEAVTPAEPAAGFHTDPASDPVSGSGSGSGVVGLAQWLRARAITTVEVIGIATDHCVRATALDAVANGFQTTVRLDLTVGVAPETVTRAKAQLLDAGVILTGG